ncbi:hypothetical protein [Endozoicomonas numazuensis]|uniref:Uncharacterized protein n=1 Tax=Endozoicomonas numazuensis TaxID=1137799 RepID=A0A081NFT4_9GAMM|nr:hypothetical protein [Endozoicomonas numazuensis]KEQ17307.1 hypothetical protein GZ78_15965 [Endozoicomonas numazuensis]
MLKNLSEHKQAVYFTAVAMFLVSAYMSIHIQTQEESGKVAIKAISLFGPFIVLLLFQILRRFRNLLACAVIYSVSSFMLVFGEAIIGKLIVG